MKPFNTCFFMSALQRNNFYPFTCCVESIGHKKIQLQDRNEFIFGKQFNRYYLMLPVRAYLERICSRSMESYFIWLRISCRLGLAIVLCLFWISLLPITFSSLPTIKLRQRTIEKHKNKLVSLPVRSQALVFVKRTANDGVGGICF